MGLKFRACHTGKEIVYFGKGNFSGGQDGESQRILNVMLMKSLSTHPSPAFDAARERLVARARETLYMLYRQVGGAHHDDLEPDPEEPRDAGKPIPPWRKTAIAAGLSAVHTRPDDPDPDLER